jgi:diguanylate cyclase (GGDEF)-like protein
MAAASAEVLHSLLTITTALTTELELTRAYDAILHVVRQVTGAQRVSLQLVDVTSAPEDDYSLVLVAGLGLPANAQIGSARPQTDGIAGLVLRRRAPLLLNGATDTDTEVQGLMRAVPGQSALCVPLVAQGQALGVLNASKIDPDQPFTESDRDFLAVLGGQAAIALDHARLYAQLAQQATVDGITGLLNHAAFQTRLQAELERASRMHQQLGLLSIDLDGFKLVNDTHGHPTGDKLLKLLAERAIKVSIREYDVACRPGGDEFAVILPHSTAEQAVTVAQRIREAVANCDTTVIGVPKAMVAASVGVSHFPTDGVHVDDLVETADNALYFAKYLGRNRVERGSSSVANFEKDPEKLHDLLVRATTSTVEALAAAIDARDTFTAGHSRRVAQYAQDLARALAKSTHYCHELRLSCLFHDVGKIGIPDGILRKAGKLSDEEFALMREHPAKGAELLQRVPALRHSIDGIRYHHERWDGKGYPDGLLGDQIPEMASIISIADAYDAMTSDRVYRGALLDEDVVRIFQSGAGIQWDAALVAVWVEVLHQRLPQEHVLAPLGAHDEHVAPITRRRRRRP